jgi:hypothetical protein
MSLLKFLRTLSSISVSSQNLLRTKQHEDPGFEIIKEVMAGGAGSVNKLLHPFAGAGGSSGGGSSSFNNPNLAALASLMAASSGGGSGGTLGGLGAAALLNPNLLLQKCEYRNAFYFFGGESFVAKCADDV